MLYLFDVDGTLIRSFMREKPKRGQDAAMMEAIAPGADELPCQGCGVSPGQRHWDNCPMVGDMSQPVYRPDLAGPTGDPYDRVELLPGRLLKIEQLAFNEGSRFGLVTNQGGVAFGYQTERQVHDRLGRVVGAFNSFHGRPFSVHVCFTHPRGALECWRQDDGRRKPGSGMLLEAMERHRADRCTTWMVGDMDVDEQAARRIGVRYYDQKEFFA